ncbi:hypothetical protein AMELA_G00219960 [Ameiurus melas]|uniref:Uncharacterized protein n=1 Tax=Ameiurus melas TaxID=219545 RepID=A0A7J6A4J5_AMEME|nr:hypothetical protein AMELA_G00219960 [Ameiurus melas]
MLRRQIKEVLNIVYNHTQFKKKLRRMSMTCDAGLKRTSRRVERENKVGQRGGTGRELLSELADSF